MSEEQKAKEIVENENNQKSPKDMEKEQEAKLRAKYPGIRPGGSAFLQKRLSKGNKQYFDSGDYNMAKAKMGSSAKPKPMTQKLIMPEGNITGDTIPTPETVPQRKASIHTQSKLASGTLS